MNNTIDMKCSWFWNLPNTQHFFFLCPDSDILKLSEEERIFWAKLHPHLSQWAESGQSGCRDESHPACCFLTSYLGSMLARRKSWQPRPVGITSLSFLNVFQHFSWIPCSVCSLELPDSVRLLCARVHTACSVISHLNLVLLYHPL